MARGRRPGPGGFGERLAEVRPELGSKGRWTDAAQFARDLGVSGQRYRTWERDNRWPGRVVLEDCFRQLASVRDRQVDVGALVRWLELGEGEPPLRASSSSSVGLQAPSDNDVLAQLLGRVRDHALDVTEAAATIMTLARAGVLTPSQKTSYIPELAELLGLAIAQAA